MESILIVEDDRLLNRGVSFALRKEGYEVISAYSRAEAMQVILSKKIDFLLLDINLPDGNGISLCKEIREKAEFPIVFLQQMILKKIWLRALKEVVMII